MEIKDKLSAVFDKIHRTALTFYVLPSTRDFKLKLPQHVDKSQAPTITKQKIER